ncbi:MAG TPA: AMP-binding protein [Candidatus Sulfotelmatobacter sp.]
MAESLAEFLLPSFRAHIRELAYGLRRGYRMEWFTYGQMLDLSYRFAQELDNRRINKGDRIILWGANSAPWVAAFLGCAMRGVVVVPLDDASSPDFAVRVLGQVQARIVVCSHEHEAGVPAATPTLILEELPQSLKAIPAEEAQFNLACRDDTLQIVFTSGTTADPKGVVITHANVLANIVPIEQQMRGYMKYENWVDPVRFLNLLPLSHVFGQFMGMFLPALMGGTVIFQNEFKPSEIVNTIRRERISVLASVPRVLQSLRQNLDRDFEDQGDLARFRTCLAAAHGKHFLLRWWMFRKIHRRFGWKFWAFISGGASLDGATEEFWGRLGYAVIQGYGLTETTSLISVNHPFRLGKGSIGKVLPGREVKLAEDGEILVRGGGVATGYWQSGKEEKVSDHEGWYRTGDVGALDEAGNLYFKGRKKDVVVTPAGLNVYPEDLEAALRKQPEVIECVVVGVEIGGNAEPCAVIVLQEEGNAGKAVQRANQSLADYQQIRRWVQWPEADFPRTSTQKPQRKLIQEFARAQVSQSRVPALDASAPGKMESLENLIAKVTGRSVATLDRNSNLETDLGLSSLERVEMMDAIEDRYQVDLGETNFNSTQTVGDLEKIMRGGAVERARYHYPHWTLSTPLRWLRIATHYSLMRPAMALLAWPQIEGRENLRGWNSPLLVISNHIDDVDLGFIQAALPARYRHWLAIATNGEALEALRTPKHGRGFFRRIYDRTQWTLGVALLNLFPLPRQAGFRKSFAYAGEAADRGYSVLVFPEGRHTPDGKLHPFREGIGVLTASLGIPVLPMRIDGLFEVKQAGQKLAPPGKIRVRIGVPIRFGAEAKDPREITAKLQKAVEAL